MAKQCYDTISDIGQYISYCPETGVFMWAKRSGSWCRLGEPITSFERHGYLRVRFRRQSIKLHRLAVFLTSGQWPDGEVDHINGVVTDNRICNLRVVTSSENAFNRAKLMRSNTSGHTGVSWYKQKGKWGAKIHAHGKQIYLGFFDVKEDAIAAYAAAKPIYHPTYVPR